jgi:DNA-binding LytR/AlgR family response regulator
METTTKISYVVVDDNEHDRLLIEDYATNQPSLFKIGSFDNPLSAVDFVKHHQPEVLFLDIGMPILNGLTFLKSLANPPLCVFMSSHGEYAIDAYELFAIDFLLKPIKQERFDLCIKHIEDYLTLKQKANYYDTIIEKHLITINEGHNTYKVDTSKILYLQALKDYTKIYTPNRTYLTLSNLKHFLDVMDSSAFVRVHRSYAVALQQISAIEHDMITISNHKIPVGKTYKKPIHDLLKK